MLKYIILWKFRRQKNSKKCIYINIYIYTYVFINIYMHLYYYEYANGQKQTFPW